MFLEILAIEMLQFAVEIGNMLQRYYFLVRITELKLEVEIVVK